MAEYKGEVIDYKVPEIELAPEEPSFKEKAGAAAYGAATGLAGGLGELEKFGAYTVPEFLGVREPGTRDQFMGRETIFPTIKEAQAGLAKLGIKPPREEVSGYQTGGEILGGIGPSLPGAVRGAGRALLGVPSKTSEAAAKEAEQIGFKLSPAQVRQTPRAGAKGSTFSAEHNQELANKLAAESTGKSATEISPDFVRGRLKELGAEFDKVYRGKEFNLDKQAVDALQQIALAENYLPPSVAVSGVKQTANNILGNYQSLVMLPGAKPSTFKVSGDALQRIRTDLLQAARASGSRQDAHVIYDLVDELDQSVARNHPDVAAKLAELRPKYRNTIILEDMVRRGGIDQGNISLEKLGEMLGAKKEGVRRATGELDRLGELGRTLKLRALWQTEGGAETEAGDLLSKVLGTTMGASAKALGLRSGAARAAQRQLAKQPSKAATTRIPQAAAAGTVTRPFQTEEQ
jgi:hypothetical protein